MIDIEYKEDLDENFTKSVNLKLNLLEKIKKIQSLIDIF